MVMETQLQSGHYSRAHQEQIVLLGRIYQDHPVKHAYSASFPDMYGQAISKYQMHSSKLHSVLLPSHWTSSKHCRCLSLWNYHCIGG